MSDNPNAPWPADTQTPTQRPRRPRQGASRVKEQDMSDTTTRTEFPVGRCTGQNCNYQEPHRHGFSCDKSCECEGIGAETEPLGEGDLETCDWGHCNRESVAMRLQIHPPVDLADDEILLSVCGWHAGWEDFPGQMEER